MQITKKRVIGLGGLLSAGLVILIKGTDLVMEGNHLTGGVITAVGFLVLVADMYLIKKE